MRILKSLPKSAYEYAQRGGIIRNKSVIKLALFMPSLLFTPYVLTLGLSDTFGFIGNAQRYLFFAFLALCASVHIVLMYATERGVFHFDRNRRISFIYFGITVAICALYYHIDNSGIAMLATGKFKGAGADITEFKASAFDASPFERKRNACISGYNAKIDALPNNQWKNSNVGVYEFQKNVELSKIADEENAAKKLHEATQAKLAETHNKLQDLKAKTADDNNNDIKENRSLFKKSMMSLVIVFLIIGVIATAFIKRAELRVGYDYQIQPSKLPTGLLGAVGDWILDIVATLLYGRTEKPVISSKGAENEMFGKGKENVRDDKIPSQQPPTPPTLSNNDSYMTMTAGEKINLNSQWFSRAKVENIDFCIKQPTPEACMLAIEKDPNISKFFYFLSEFHNSAMIERIIKGRVDADRTKMAMFVRLLNASGNMDATENILKLVRHGNNI